MLVRRVRIALVLKECKGADEFWSCLRRCDDFLDEAAFGRRELANLSSSSVTVARRAGVFVGSFGKFATIENAHCAFSSQTRLNELGMIYFGLFSWER
jgi:hypothetical protein